MGKALALLGLIGLAVAAVLSGSDRQSRDFPNSPSLVGWPYDTGAARAKAALAFVRSGPASAIGYARRAILSDPISAQAVSILGRAELFAQRMPEAQRAFQVSGQLGWRDEMTQIYWLDQALQGSDFRVAAERLDALLRQSPNDENRDSFIAAVGALPEGRIALAERLKLAPSWAQTLVGDVRELPADQLLLRVDLMRRTGRGVWDCPATETITQRLINLNMLDEAQTVWRLNCQASGSLVYDGGFEHLDTLKATSAFDWQLSNRGDTEISLVSDASGHRSLALEVTASFPIPIVRQLVVLKQGRYRVSWRTPDTGITEAHSLQVSLACQPDLSSALAGKAVPGQASTWSADFSIDGECPARQLAFWLPPRAPIHLDDISLTALDGKVAD